MRVVRVNRFLLKVIVYFVLVFMVFVYYAIDTSDSKDIVINKLIQENTELRNQFKTEQEQLKRLENKLNLLNKKRILTTSDIKSLERIVEAEAENQGVSGKRMVSSVVLNRWLESKNKSIDDIVTEKNQFQPVANGRYYEVVPTDETKRAVEMSLHKDYSKGSKYFRNEEISDRSTDTFFGRLTKTIEHKQHQFYK